MYEHSVYSTHNQETVPMPTIFIQNGFRFSFYAADCREPHHVHVHKGGISAKFWLNPIRLAGSTRFRPTELRQIEEMIREHYAELVKAWDDYCA